MLQPLLLTQREVQVLSERQSLPPWQRHLPQPVWSITEVKPSSPFPPVTAAYHNSLDLPESHVRSKGLHVPVVLTVQGPRRLSKWEILHFLGMSLNMILPQKRASRFSCWARPFPAIYAFLKVLHALSLRPEDPWTNEQVVKAVQHGIRAFSPELSPWRDFVEVHFQGWASLVAKHEAEARFCEINTML